MQRVFLCVKLELNRPLRIAQRQLHGVDFAFNFALPE